jgi:hypothetical protein
MALPFDSGRSYSNQGTLHSELFARMFYKICLHLFVHVYACLHVCLGISVYKGRVASSGIMFIPDFVKHCLLADMDPNGHSNAKLVLPNERRVN